MTSQRSESVDFPITNKYTFARVFSDPDNVRPLLEEVLKVPVGEIRYVAPEHAMEPSLRGRGVRMDVFVEDGTGTVYDVEMQNAEKDDLALRSRYLLSSFDRDRIKRGDYYQDLGASVVIFVCAFDPIGAGQQMSVVIPMVAGLNVPYDDKTMRIFLNARGAASKPQKEGRLDAFLSYVDGGDTMGDEWVERLDGEVRALNADEGWRDTVMSYELDLQEAEYRGRKEGREEGRIKTAQLYRTLAQELRKRGREAELADALLDTGTLQRLAEELGVALADSHPSEGPTSTH